MEVVKSLFRKHKDIFWYFLCSVASFLFEIIIGWVLLQFLQRQIVVANTVTVALGAILHYFLTLALVFRKKNTRKTILIYIITFLFGLMLQNLIIGLFYNQFLLGWVEMWRYLVSKAFSVAIPFFALFYIRRFLNKKFV